VVKRLFECSCGAHALSVEADEYNGVTYGVEVTYWELGKGRGRERLLARLRRAWGVLRGDALLLDSVLLSATDAHTFAQELHDAAGE
jgi:hypothetical protein